MTNLRRYGLAALLLLGMVCTTRADVAVPEDHPAPKKAAEENPIADQFGPYSTILAATGAIAAAAVLVLMWTRRNPGD